MHPYSLRYLIEQYNTQKITPEELALLKDMLSSEDIIQQEGMTGELETWMKEKKESDTPYDAMKWQPILKNVLKIDKKPVPVKQISERVAGRYFSLIRYAASILLLIGLSVVVYHFVNQTEGLSGKQLSHTSIDDIEPGYNKAILTLGDGSTIVLDSTKQGEIARQGNASITIRDDGEIRYDPKGNFTDKVLYNTMQTPRGGQYRLVLPDGSRVWMNAASSITYPAMFTGNERKVKIIGEVYIEVVPNKSKPFFVNVNDKVTVKALGTGFNISAYPDEDGIITTLIEGKVLVTDLYGKEVETANSGKNELILTPGQQAIKIGHPNTSQLQHKSINKEQVTQILAWKNGYFDFESLSILEMARQIERWYDVKFDFDGDFSRVELRGKMDREVKLSDIIHFFNDYGYKTELNGRVITVRK